MAADLEQQQGLEIAHVLFLDIVGYSKLLTNEQRELLKQLNQIVRETRQFKSAEAAKKLVRLATGDGMALAFLPVPMRRCGAHRKSAGSLWLTRNFICGWG